MTDIQDANVRKLLDEPNHAVVSTLNADGSVHSTLAWQEIVDGKIAVNGAVGRHWPTNLQRDPRVTVVVYASDNPYEYVEIRGTASGSTVAADQQIDRLAKKYLGQDTYPFRQPGEERITFSVEPKRVRYQAPA